MKKKASPIVVKDIHLLQVEVTEQKMNVKAFKEKKEHKLNVGHKLLHDLENEQIKLEFVFSFDNSDEEPLLFFQIDFHFRIAHLSNFYELKSESYPVFSSHLVTTLIGICFSTARGIILEKLNNAGIKNTLLPIVSPQDMLADTESKRD